MLLRFAFGIEVVTELQSRGAVKRFWYPESNHAPPGGIPNIARPSASNSEKVTVNLDDKRLMSA